MNKKCLLFLLLHLLHCFWCNAILLNAVKNYLTLRQISSLLSYLLPYVKYLVFCSLHLLRTKVRWEQLEVLRAIWKKQDMILEVNRVFFKLCCVSPFYPISLPFSKLKVKALRVKALKASMAQYHKHKCLLLFETLSGNRALNFILGNIVFLLKTKQEFKYTPERALLSWTESNPDLFSWRLLLAHTSEWSPTLEIPSWTISVFLICSWFL